MVLVLGEGIHVRADGWTSWSTNVNTAFALGPVASRSNAAQTVSLALDAIPVGTRSLYLGANRGRGQLYPDGSSSNLSLRKTEVSGACQAVTYLVKRYGSWSTSSTRKVFGLHISCPDSLLIPALVHE